MFSKYVLFKKGHQNKRAPLTRPGSATGAHPTPYPERHIDRSSRSCNVHIPHVRVSQKSELLNILQQQPQICSDLNTILHTQDDICYKHYYIVSYKCA